MRKLIFSLSCLIALSACIEDTPPINAAMVVDDSAFSAPFIAKEPGQLPPSRALSPDQIGVLGQWLHAHRSGWDFLAGSPPRPSIEVILVHDDGTRSRLDIITNWYGATSARLLVLWREDQNGKVLDAAIRKLSSEELATLERLLAAKQ